MINSNEKGLKSHWKRIATLLVLYDVIAINAVYAMALWIRFDGQIRDIPREYIMAWVKSIPAVTVVTIAVMVCLRLYNSIWRFASYNELEKTLVASFANVAVQVMFMNSISQRMPITYYAFGWILEFSATTGVRFAYRLIRMMGVRLRQKSVVNHKKNVIIIGAGEAGKALLAELTSSSHLDDKVCCFIDDNNNKKGRYVDGVPVIGNRDHIMEAVQKYKINQIVFAIPTASPEQKRDILNICKETGCEIKVIPGIYQLVKEEVSISSLKDVSVEDLLGREQVKVNIEEIIGYVNNKVVMVTGGGGSIGSELCRQIAAHGPKQLIIFEIYENNAYDIEQELKMKFPSLNLLILIGSVRDTGRINMVFEKYRPQIVYHAAAHKHVPLMETSPNEAIKNNVFGTYKTALAASQYGTKKFVLISTDKAVNPTNIMGASKRLCEMIVQTLDNMSDTEFVAVRFGNVLGSNGSVIPLFKKQIAKGGPVTVTHPDIIRYFMTIPEAVSLVLQAGAYAKGGEIFVLDMGEPVKIDDLARNLIKLSGYKPDADIKVEYTGLRPGEKLYEEKLMAEEGMQTTHNNLIHIGKPIEIDADKFLQDLETLREESYKNSDNINEIVSGIVGTYKFTV